MKSRKTMRMAWGRSVSAGIAALLLFGIGWIAPAPARAQGGVDFWTDELDVGGCEVGTTYTTQFWVGNPKSATNAVTIVVQGTDGPFTTPNKGASAVIKPGWWVYGDVVFRPTAAGQAKGTLSVVTSDPASPFLILPLRGTGVGDELPDLSGDWKTPSGDLRVDILHARRADAGGRARVEANVGGGVPNPGLPNVQSFTGQFDGQRYFGWSYDSIGRLAGVFGFVQDVNDPDTLKGLFEDLNGNTIAKPVLHRRSPFSGIWRVTTGSGSDVDPITPLGDMPFYRISAEKARQLVASGRFGNQTLDGPWPTSGVSWYLGDYNWSGGGQMLGYTKNSWEYAKPGLYMYGRYGERAGTHSGFIRAEANGGADGRSPTSFRGHFNPDGDRVYYDWGGTYLGPFVP